ncbi:MAG: prepilin peptidase [Candidatus Pacebacteria bacterium]|nr:prepilin peptidase [Candidatus Paceibacterota bacterium]
MYLLVIIFGLIVGSFLNCLIWRLFQEESLWGRSYCPHCRHQISWYDNIPIFSFIFLRGSCRHCAKKISWQYPAVEAITAVLFVAAFYFLPDLEPLSIALARNWLVIAVMIVVFVFDLRWQLVSLLLVVPAIFIAVAFNLFLGFFWWQIVLSLALAFAFFWFQYLLTKKKGIGEGDIYLGLLIGAVFVNLRHLLLVILIAYLLGSVVAIVLMFLGKKRWQSRLPLGVFLAVASVLVLLFHEVLTNWYFSLFS